ncbi:lymphotactin-like isoform X1 [Simochromis diagramma]|uniref:lymphotactin-like isoform X1 n=1 Tax=Simochromis diagramma TaxID=43689 RepID=UPI001A7ED885|nr:lymphotactin-like isoform X1 [Simochromis diagramma]
MQSSLIVAALLCFTTWMSSVRATPISIRSCCVVWSKTRVPLDRIVNYSIQTEEHCRIKAVQLRTVLGKTICAKPGADWTRKAIEKVDRENSQKGFTSDMMPTGSTPATSTASPKPEMLRTVLGKTICANPNADWTIQAMEWVDKKKAPTTSTASPTSGNITQKDKETGQSLTMLCRIHCCVVPWTKTTLCPTN